MNIIQCIHLKIPLIVQFTLMYTYSYESLFTTIKFLSYPQYGFNSFFLVLKNLNSVMFIIGILANAVVICVLLLNRGSLKAPPGIYVFHLAFADSLLLISLPFAADNRLRGYWKFGRLVQGLKTTFSILFQDHSYGIYTG